MPSAAAPRRKNFSSLGVLKNETLRCAFTTWSEEKCSRISSIFRFHFFPSATSLATFIIFKAILAAINAKCARFAASELAPSVLPHTLLLLRMFRLLAAFR